MFTTTRSVHYENFSSSFFFYDHPCVGLFTVVLYFVAQTIKSLIAMQEAQVLSLGLDDPLEKEMATHSSILA